MGLGAASWLCQVGPSPTGLLGTRDMGSKRPRKVPQPPHPTPRGRPTRVRVYETFQATSIQPGQSRILAHLGASEGPCVQAGLPFHPQAQGPAGHLSWPPGLGLTQLLGGSRGHGGGSNMGCRAPGQPAGHLCEAGRGVC